MSDTGISPFDELVIAEYERVVRSLRELTTLQADKIARLRGALERCIDALDTVRDGLAVHETSAEVLGAESILRHAAKGARAALLDRGGSDE